MPVISRPEPERRRKRRPPAVPDAPEPRWNVLGFDPILDEVGKPLGLALWQRFRDLDLWTRTPVAQRRDLFREQDHDDQVPEFTIDPAGHATLAEPLRLFARLVAHPELAVAEVLAGACLQVAEWAHQQEHDFTTEFFTEMAAAVLPDEPDYARYAGRAARRRAAYDRGVRWYKRSVVLGRIRNDPAARVLAYIGWGTLEEHRGAPEMARMLYLRGLRTARRSNLRQEAAAASHDLLVLCQIDDTYEEGMLHAEAALAGYNVTEPRLPALAHDIAVLWCFRGYFSAAMPLFEAALLHISSRPERIQVVGSICRAAGATRQIDRFYETLDEVVLYAARFGEGTAPALINVARGARALRREALGRELASQALQTARRTGEPVAQRIAQSILDLTEPVDYDLEAPVEVNTMADRVLAMLAKFAAPV